MKNRREPFLFDGTFYYATFGTMAIHLRSPHVRLRLQIPGATWFWFNKTNFYRLTANNRDKFVKLSYEKVTPGGYYVDYFTIHELVDRTTIPSSKEVEYPA